MHNESPRFKGQSIELAGDTYVVPPIALGALRAGAFDQIRSLTFADDPPMQAHTRAALAICLVALERNYPHLTLESLASIVDVVQLGQLLRIVLEQSGFTRRNALADGESQAQPTQQHPDAEDDSTPIAWATVYIDFASTFGWTFEYIDEYVTLPRCYEIWSAWKTTPPMHRALAALLHEFSGSPSSSSSSSRRGAHVASSDSGTESSGDLMRDLAGAGVGIASALPADLRAMIEQTQNDQPARTN